MTSTVINCESKQPMTICRCCRVDGCYKDISTEYYFSGQREVYEDMLKDTFNIQIAYQDRELNSSRYICEDCIVRLRDAHTFKQTVLRSEEIFADYSVCLQLQNSLVIDNQGSNCEVQLESVKIEAQPLDMEFEVKSYDNHSGEEFHDDHSFDDDEILANIKLELSRADENSLKPTKIKKKKLEKKSKKRSKIKDKYDQIKKLKTNSKTDKNWLKIAERRGNGPILRDNSLKLLENSTICVFQWNKSRYRCFCCKEPFSDMNLLREHTNNQHTLQNIEKKIIIQQNRLVKVEVTTLFCKLCHREIENLNALRNHLGKEHGIQFELGEDLLVPFKIQNGSLQCQICSEVFTMFRLLNIHMNKHYQKQVCHICGAGFSNLVFLNLHKTRSHRPFHCKQCGLVFKNKIDKKGHDITVHDMKFERKLRFPCPYCPERFFQENFRVQHLVEKHGMSKPEHKCPMCPKVFITRSLRNNHAKNVHMKEKNHECDVCHHFFYTKSDVARHRVTHTGEKRFSCGVCSNLFATKDSLRRHVKRTHAGVNGT